jgi:hypothetical protein
MEKLTNYLLGIVALVFSWYLFPWGLIAIGLVLAFLIVRDSLARKRKERDEEE